MDQLEGKCGTCKSWCPYSQLYDDELEPDDVGVCQCEKSPNYRTGQSEDNACDCYNL